MSFESWRYVHSIMLHKKNKNFPSQFSCSFRFFLAHCISLKVCTHYIRVLALINLCLHMKAFHLRELKHLITVYCLSLSFSCIYSIVWIQHIITIHLLMNVWIFSICTLFFGLCWPQFIFKEDLFGIWLRVPFILFSVYVLTVLLKKWSWHMLYFFKIKNHNTLL